MRWLFVVMYVFALPIGIASFVISAEPADPLLMELDVPDIKQDDCLSALREIARLMPQSLNVEIRGKDDQIHELRKTSVTIPKGRYRLKELLRKVINKDPKVSWSVSKKCANVAFTFLDKDVDPLSGRLDVNDKLEVTARDFIAWLNQQDPALKMQLVNFFQKPTKVAITARKGSTVRDLLNEFGENSGMDWEAVVFDVPQKLIIEIKGDPKSRRIEDGPRILISFYRR